MTLGEHLEELRRRIIYALLGIVAGAIVGMVFAPEIIEALKEPYSRAMQELGQQPNLVVLDATSGLTNYLKVAFYSGFLLAAPWVFYHVWMFVAAGLHERERRYVRLAVPFSVLLFVGGAVFFLGVVSRRILYFLLSLSGWLGMMPMITFENHISFMTRMMVVFGLAFQTPLVILILSVTGLVSMQALHHYRKHVIVVILIVSATFTPPDPFSQMALAIPMWLLYELGVLLAFVFVHRRRRKTE